MPSPSGRSRITRFLPRRVLVIGIALGAVVAALAVVLVSLGGPTYWDGGPHEGRLVFTRGDAGSESLTKGAHEALSECGFEDSSEARRDLVDLSNQGHDATDIDVEAGMATEVLTGGGGVWLRRFALGDDGKQLVGVLTIEEIAPGVWEVDCGRNAFAPDD